MDKYKSTEAYVMNELKKAHTRIEQLENNLDEVLKKLRAAECHIINNNEYIIELEGRLGIEGDV